MAVTGTWRAKRPLGTGPIRDLTLWMPDNFEYIETWLATEHVFPGSHGEGAGRHLPGSCRAVKYAASANIASMTGVPTGALAYVTDNHRFVYYNGTEWVSPASLLHSVGGSMTGNLDVTGTNLDGRAPSADGAKLDQMSTGADTCGVCLTTGMSHSDRVATPSMPTSSTFATTDCKYMAVQASGSKVCSTKVDAAGAITTQTIALGFVIGVK